MNALLPCLNIAFWDQVAGGLPLEIVGGLILAVITGAGGWVTKKLRKRKSKKTESAIEESGRAPTAAIESSRWSDYLSDLIRRGSTLSFGDPASWTVDRAESIGLVTLEQVWTPLRAADSQFRSSQISTHGSIVEENEGVNLKALIENTNDSFIVLGDPGSGKSTSLASLAVDMARLRVREPAAAPLPIWVNLSTIPASDMRDPIALLLAGVPEIEVAVGRGGSEAGTSLQNLLRSVIVEGSAVLLLDGLDEVKEHALEPVRSAISSAANLRTGSRIVATCRSFDYRQSVPVRKIAIERELELLPFNQNEKSMYVRRWYKAAVGIGRFSPTEAAELSAALEAELLQDDLSELAESPLLLALLTLIHSEEAKLPETRAVVCDRAIKFMLADSAKWRIRDAGSATTAAPPVLTLATEVAYQSHLAEEQRNGVSVGISIDLVKSKAEEMCSVMAAAESSGASLSPEDLTQRFIRSHGLLLYYGNGEYKFAHRYFQEFLVGQYYAVGAHRTEAVERGSSIHWREPFRLMASFAGHEGENLFYILTLIEDLLGDDDSSSIPASQLAAEMLAEIGRRRIALRQFGHVLREQPSDLGEQAGLWARARARMVLIVQDSNCALPERERSAAVLGMLGDPRFVTTNGRIVGPWENTCSVPAGVARLGLDQQRPEGPDTSVKWVASPGRFVDLPCFAVSTYLVTNAQFRGFVESDGYGNLNYWKGEFARAWASGDTAMLRLVREHWLSTVYKHHAKEIRDGEIDPHSLEEESERRTEPRSQPYYWFDRRFNQPNQPVVGINWWEAAAYCEWATAQGHRDGTLARTLQIALPTEFEWERASRPTQDDRLYPWGNEWSEKRAHVSTNTLNLRRPAPVGVYLESWTNGPCDIAGNVWEWTASLHRPFGEEHDVDRLSASSLAERSVRGSSWYNSAHFARCSARGFDRSYNLFYDVGFRIVVVQMDAVRL